MAKTEYQDPVRIPMSGKRGAGKFILVDAADYAEVSRYKWHVAGIDGADYPARTQWVGGRQTKVKLHRQLLGLSYRDGNHVDHRNRDRYDCRRCNIHVCTVSENMKNRRGWAKPRPAKPTDPITIPTAARLIGVSRKTLWSRVATLPVWQSCVAYRVGRRTYLSTARLRAAGHLEVA